MPWTPALPVVTACCALPNLRIPAADVLGEVGKGFRYAQVRLAPARLTHCMRWLGQARRAHDIALEYTRRRQAFGKPLAEHEGVGFMLADNDMDLHTARLHIWHTAWMLDQGEKCNFESSRAKVVCSEAEWRVVDRCVQMLGGQGVTGRETAVMRIFTDMRAFRIYDGPKRSAPLEHGAQAGAPGREGCAAAGESSSVSALLPLEPLARYLRTQGLLWQRSHRHFRIVRRAVQPDLSHHGWRPQLCAAQEAARAARGLRTRH